MYEYMDERQSEMFDEMQESYTLEMAGLFGMAALSALALFRWCN